MQTAGATPSPSIIGSGRALLLATRLARTAAPRPMLYHLGAQGLGALIPAASVRVTTLLVDAVAQSAQDGLGPVLRLAVLQAGLLLLQYAFSTVSNLSSQLASQLTANHVLGLLAERSQAVPFPERQTTRFNEELAFLRLNTPFRSYQPVQQLTSVLSAFITLVSVLAIIGSAQGWIAVLVLAATMPTLYAAYRATRVQFAASVAQAGDNFKADYFYRQLTLREHAAEIYLHRAAPFLLGKWRRHKEQALQRAWQALLGQTYVEIPAQILNVGSMGFTTVLLGRFVWQGTLSVGAFVADVQAIRSLQQAATGVYQAFASLLQVALFMERLGSFLASPIPASIIPSGQVPAEPPDFLVLRDVAYRYPDSDRDSLVQVTATLPERALTVVMGPNGAGKTTLLYVLAGLLPVSRGMILYPPNLLRDGRPDVALVAQDFARFSATLYENVTLKEPDTLALQGEAVQALEEAGAASLLSQLDLTSLLGPDMNQGAELSRGEWQRIALARALIRRPRLLLLDEPTASADPTQRQEVRRLIEQLRSDSTVVVVTHDRPLAEKADQVLLLDAGRLVAAGTHEELMDQSLNYRRLIGRKAREDAHEEAM